MIPQDGHQVYIYLLNIFHANTYFLKVSYDCSCIFKHRVIVEWENKEKLIADGKVNF